MPGSRTLEPEQLIELEWEPAQQDGYAFRAVRVWPRGKQPHEAPADNASPDRASPEGTSAYRSTLIITFDGPAAT